MRRPLSLALAVALTGPALTALPFTARADDNPVIQVIIPVTDQGISVTVSASAAETVPAGSTTTAAAAAPVTAASPPPSTSTSVVPVDVTAPTPAQDAPAPSTSTTAPSPVAPGEPTPGAPQAPAPSSSTTAPSSPATGTATVPVDAPTSTTPGDTSTTTTAAPAPSSSTAASSPAPTTAPTSTTEPAPSTSAPAPETSPATVEPSTDPSNPTTTASPTAPPPATRPAPSDTAQHRSGMPWANGVFAHSKDRVQKYQEVTGKPVDTLVVFPARGSWDTIMDSWWLDTAPEGFTGTLDVGVPLWQADGDLATAAAGGYDAQWEQLGRTIHQRYPGSSVRIGWEFNLAGWKHHATDENVEEWKQAFRKASAALKKGGPSLLVTWNPNKGKGDSLSDATKAWPGDDAVDIVGLDGYDWWPAYDESTWPEHRDGDQGWDYWVNFARQHGKKFSVPEWGVAPGNDHGGGDNPLYISKVMGFLAAEHAKDRIVHSASYFDETEGYIANSLAAGQAPRAADQMRESLGQIAGGTAPTTSTPTSTPAPSATATETPAPNPATDEPKPSETASPAPATETTGWSDSESGHGPVPQG